MGIETIIQKIVDAEQLRQYCFSHLTTLTANGRVKDRFEQIRKSAEVNLEILERFCRAHQYCCTVPRDSCTYCNVKAESFSLIGALNIGLEVSRYLAGAYKELIVFTDEPGDRAIFKEILGDCTRQRNFLKAELKYVSAKQEEQDPTYMESACMPQILSRLST